MAILHEPPLESRTAAREAEGGKNEERDGWKQWNERANRAEQERRQPPNQKDNSEHVPIVIRVARIPKKRVGRRMWKKA